MNPNILVVDDEADIRTMLCTHFTFLDYTVHTAGNGQEALQQMAEQRYEVVISDIMMPQMDGITLLKTVREEYPIVSS